MNGAPVTTEFIRYSVYGSPEGVLAVYNSIEGWHVGHIIKKADDDTFTVLRFVGADRATVYRNYRIECEGLASEEEALRYAIVNGRMCSRSDVAKGA